MGGLYEVADSTIIKYYAFAGQTIAMNDGTGLQYLLTDHLGSMVVVTDANGTLTSQQRYLPFGEVRELPSFTKIQETDFGYTGQRSLEGTGLMDYRARFYDPYLNRFIQPDSIIPSATSPQTWNRYAFVNNNPVRYTDPTGHMMDEGDDGNCAGYMDCEYGAYTAAGIATQNPFFVRGSEWRIKGRYTGIGPAKATDEQMETPYGEVVIDEFGKKRGVGLGLREEGTCSILNCEMDQADPVVAWQAMEARISQSVKVCVNNGCSETDIFLVAALASNSSMLPDTVRTALAQNSTSSGSTIINWNDVLANDTKNGSYYVGIIISFAINVQKFQSQGGNAPNVDWNYISSVTSGTFP